VDGNPIQILGSRIQKLWQSWSPREKMLVILAGVGLLVSGFYNLFWLPVNNSIARLSNAVPEARSQLAQMQIQAKQVPTRPTATLRKSLLPTLEESIDNHGLREHLNKLEPTIDDSAQVVLTEIGYTNLIKWIVNLERQYAISVSSAKLRATDTPGIVSARIVLRSDS
jgi:general secretion pathway protein M